MDSDIVLIQRHVRLFNVKSKLIKMRSIITIQSHFRKYLVINGHKKFLETKKLKIKETLNNIIDNVFHWFHQKTINSNRYHSHLMCIDEILEDVKKITRRHNDDTILRSITLIYIATLKVNTLIDKICTYSINRSLEWIFEDRINNIDSATLEFLVDYFIPYQICVSDSLLNSSLEYRKHLLSLKWNINFVESTNNTFVCISLVCEVDNALEITFIGLFKKYPFNLFDIDILHLNKKWKSLVNDVSSLHIDNNYKLKYISQFDINYFVGCTNEFLVNIVDCSFRRTEKLIYKPINEIINSFLNNSFADMCEILTSLIIFNEKSQQIAVVLFEILVHNGTENVTAHDVFCKLHWSIQRIFEISYTKICKLTKNMKTKNVSNNLTYEQRIICSNAPSFAIEKAIEKLQLTTSGDVGPKASQWLDGFLKIPFGNYHYNEFFHSLHDIRTSLKKSLNQINSCSSTYDILKEYLPNCETEYQIKKVIDLIKNIHKDVVLSNLSTEPLIRSEISNSDASGNEFMIKYTPLFYDISGISIKAPPSSPSTTFSTSNPSLLNLKVEKSLIENNQRINEQLKTVCNNECDSEIVLYNNLEVLIEKYDIHCNNKVSYVNNVRNILDESCYGHDDAKQQFIRLVAQWMNGNINGSVIGLQGPPGNGKTTLAKMGLSKCLYDSSGNSHPFGMIALGGSSNGSTIVGHNFTYVGSICGKIVEILIDTKCMNPIIYFDEIDKISKTEHGREIVGILTHLTDTTQNDTFEDRYFSGVRLDLSKALFVMSFNDESKIDPILKDRMQIIRTKSLSTHDKTEITKKHILPSIIETVGFAPNSINIEPSIVKYIVDTYTHEAGVRKLKEILYDLVREYNLRSVINDLSINNDNDGIFTISKHFVEDVLEKRFKSIPKILHTQPQIGLVNGLYATVSGIGGITTIEVHKTFGSFLKLILTGNQGSIMKESMQVALTSAWSIIPDDIKTYIFQNKDIECFSLHIHAPACATPKDGPSAGAAIALGIISQLCKIPIRHDIALTGEIDLNCNITQIGGVYSKLQGAFKSDIKRVFIPDDNKQDLELLKKEGKLDEFIDKMEIITVKSLKELIPFVFIIPDNFDFKF